MFEVGADFFADDFADGTGVLVVDAVDDAQGAGGDEVAAGDAHVGAGHGGVGQPLGEEGFEFDADGAGGGFDAFEGGRVGDADVVVVLRLQAAAGHFGFNLGTGTVHEDEADAEGGEEVAVVGEALGVAAIGEHFAAEGDDEGAPAEGVDVGGGGAYPRDEFGGFVLWQGGGGGGVGGHSC